MSQTRLAIDHPPTRLQGIIPQEYLSPSWRLLATAAAALALAGVMLAATPSAGYAQPSGGQRLTASLTGEQVLPDPGPSGASAQLAVQVHQAQICWDVRWQGVEPTAAHLHRGAHGEVGPVVIGLFEAQSPVTGQTAREGCTGADGQVLQEILRQPEQFYAQLTSQENPNGAARGQLAQEELPRTGSALPSPAAQLLFVLLVGVGASLPALNGYRNRRRRR